MRRLPIYILLDTSGSMRGEPIEAVKAGLQSLVSSLRKDPYALETVYLSVITFDKDVHILCPLTELENFVIPEFEVPRSSPTNTGAALEILFNSYKKDVVLSTPTKKGDWLPIAVLMTDGSPSDTQLYNEMTEKLKGVRFAQFIALAAGPSAKIEPLKKLTTGIFSLDTMESNMFSKFWIWVSTAIQRQSQSLNSERQELPPPPKEIKFVI